MSELKRVKIEYDGGIAAKDAGEKGAPFVVLYTYLPIINVTIDAEIRKTCPQCGQEVSDATD